MPSAETFTYWGVELPYCRARYNHSGENERAVEIPIARWFIDRCRRDDRWRPGLEVGNVLSHYETPTWPVVDRYEAGGRVHNIDLFDWDEPVDWIVSISTLEHVRWDEPDLGRHPDGPLRALKHLSGLLRPGGAMLATTPMGWQPFWDSAVLDGRLPVKPERQATLVRDGDGWRQTEALEHRRYAASTIWAESVWVGEFQA